MTVPRTPDVLVIGGGVIGCAIARELAATREVLLVDRGPIGGEASSAAAGVLAVASGDDDDARLELRRASRAAFPALSAALAEETGVDVGFTACGVARLACSTADALDLDARAAGRHAQGLRAEVLDAAAARALEPAASPGTIGAILFPDDGMVVADRLVTALADAARRRGATLVPGLPAFAIERQGERVTRVRVGVDWIAPGLTVLATGAWGTMAVSDLDLGIPIVPVRGQMAAIRPSRAPRCILTSGSAFLIPRPHGEVWVGATFEEAGFVKAVTADGLAALAGHLRLLAPALLDAPLVRAWSGLRPLCPDGGPVLGPPPGFANLLVALGHHRNGILLAPITAQTLRACADGLPPPAAAAPFVLR